MTARVRFAPSPTGRLHLGNARIALVNYLFARHAGGAYILRIDDTDRERSRDEFTDAIRVDLRWLGIDWDEEYHQSARLDRYGRAMERLKAVYRAYPCYETAEELDYKRKRQLARGKPPIYDRAARALTDADRAKLEAEGRKPHWRFLLAPGAVTWTDLVRGECHYDADHLSDPVLMREDGVPLYTLTSVVDDAELGVSHVIRGEDHVTNTAPQIQLFEALHGTPPAFAHLPLMVDAQGKGLSKRLGSLTLEALREQGIEPMAVNSLLGRMGASHAVEPAQDMAALAKGFDLAQMGRASPRYDPVELDHLNARLLHAMPFAAAEPRLAAMGIAADESFWRWCAAISSASPTRRNGGGCAAPLWRRPSRMPIISAWPAPCCRPSPGPARPGATGPAPWPPAAGARAASCSIRCDSRLPAAGMDRNWRLCYP